MKGSERRGEPRFLRRGTWMPSGSERRGARLMAGLELGLTWEFGEGDLRRSKFGAYGDFGGCGAPEGSAEDARRWEALAPRRRGFEGSGGDVGGAFLCELGEPKIRRYSVDVDLVGNGADFGGGGASHGGSSKSAVGIDGASTDGTRVCFFRFDDLCDDGGEEPKMRRKSGFKNGIEELSDIVCFLSF